MSVTARPKYHQSEILMFLKCGKQWEFRYARGIKTPPSGAATVGSAVDTAVSRNLAQKIASGKDLPGEEVADTYSTDFDKRAKESEWGDDDPGEQKDVGMQLLKVHHTKAAPKIQPATVQESFEIETDAGYNLGGTIDLTEKSGVIADTKTSRTAYDKSDLFRAIQPALYDFAFEALNGKKSPGFRFDVLVKPTKTKPALYDPVVAKVTQGDRAWLFEALDQMHRAITAGVALPAPEGSWWCSPKWCGYWSMCKGKKGK